MLVVLAMKYFSYINRLIEFCIFGWEKIPRIRIIQPKMVQNLIKLLQKYLSHLEMGTYIALEIPSKVDANA